VSPTSRPTPEGQEPRPVDETDEATRSDAGSPATERHGLEHAGSRIELDDVDEVIGLAAKLREREANELTLADLEEVGRELDIEETYVRRAVEALEAKRREAALAERRAGEVRRARWRLVAKLAAGLAALALLLGVGTWFAGGAVERELRAQHADVEAKRSQVVNVLERQAATERQ
jgi:hypothetical protein